MNPVMTIVVALDADALLAFAEATRAIEKLADAISARPVERTEYQRGGGASPAPIATTVAAPPEAPKATRADQGLQAPADPPANVVAPVAQRPPVPAAIYESPWTAPRKAILQREYPTIHGADWKQKLRTLLEAEPGPALPSDQGILGYAAGAMKLRREVAPQPVNRMDAIARVSQAIAGEPLTCDFETVRHWAAQRGIQMASVEDMAAVNAKRFELGLPAFKLPEYRRGSAA